MPATSASPLPTRVDEPPTPAPFRPGQEKSILAQYQKNIDVKSPTALADLEAALRGAGYNVERQGDRFRFAGSPFGWIDVQRNKGYLTGRGDDRAWVFQPFHSKEDQARLGILTQPQMTPEIGHYGQSYWSLMAQDAMGGNLSAARRLLAEALRRPDLQSDQDTPLVDDRQARQALLAMMG